MNGCRSSLGQTELELKVEFFAAAPSANSPAVVLSPEAPIVQVQVAVSGDGSSGSVKCAPLGHERQQHDRSSVSSSNSVSSSRSVK